MAISLRDVTALLLGQLPPGIERLYDLRSSSGIYKLYEAVAASVKKYGHDLLDKLEKETDPSQVDEKLPDWEIAMGLTTTRAALYGIKAQRRGQVLSRLREFGAANRDGIRSVLGTLLGYADPGELIIVECDRKKLRDAHSYTIAPTVGLGGGPVFTRTITVTDDGKISKAGFTLVLVLTTSKQSVQVVVTAPDASTYTFAAGYLGNGGVIQEELYFRSATAAGVAINGTWTIVITDTLFVGLSIHVGSYLFVEGTGRDSKDRDGLGSAIFHWGVWADPAKVGPDVDYDAVLKTIDRIKPAHSVGRLLRSSLTLHPTVLQAIPGDTVGGIPGQCIPVYNPMRLPPPVHPSDFSEEGDEEEFQVAVYQQQAWFQFQFV